MNVPRVNRLAKSVPMKPIASAETPTTGEMIAVLALASKRSNLKAVHAGPVGHGQITMCRQTLDQIVVMLERLSGYELGARR